jgi:hypothetical protein
LHLQQVRNFEHAFAAAETFADSLAFGVGIGQEISGLDLSELSAERVSSSFSGLGGWPLPALADDCALHATRTKGFLQSGQKTLESRLGSIRLPVFR